MKTSIPLCVGTVAINPSGKVIPIRCKRWSCSTCARLNALVLSIRVVEGIKRFQNQHVPLTFVTLTFWGSATPKRAYEQLPVYWSRIAMRLARLARKGDGRKLEYAAFIEEQSRGVPHLHAVATISITTRELKDLAVKCGFGHQAKAEPVKGPAVGWYVAKYLTKSDGTMPNAPAHHRRVRFSQNWPELPAPTHDSTLIVKSPSETLVAWALRAQAAGIALGLDQILSRVDELLSARDDELTLSEYYDRLTAS